MIFFNVNGSMSSYSHYRSVTWAVKARRQDLLERKKPGETKEDITTRLNKSNVMCQNHFEDSQFTNVSTKKRLITTAVPTLFDIPNPPQKIAPKRPAPTTRRDLPSKPKKKKISGKQICKGTSEQIADLERKNHALKMQVHQLKRKLRKYTTPAATVKLQSNSRLSKARKIADLQSQLADYISGPKLDFVMSQIRSAVKKSKGRRWTFKDKALALSLLHSSPKTYRLLQRIFDLPSVKTLKLAMKNIGVQPGFNNVIFEALEKKMSSQPETSKLVVLAIDEIALKEGLTYDAGLDVVEGLCDSGNGPRVLANHALGFMIRGIVDKWKQALGYFLSSGPMKGAEMKTLVIDCIQKLKAIGLTVIVVVGDQGSNNRNLFEKQLGVSLSAPFFMVDEQKVFVMYDPPHLLKNIRNNLKNHGYTWEDKSIEWKYLEEFFKKDSANKTGIRMAPKSTALHFSLAMFNSLSVPKAAQVLSHTVAAGMTAMARWNVLPEDASDTAQFAEDMDQLFNAFNSRVVNSGAVMRHAMSENSKHKEFLHKKLEWMKKQPKPKKHQATGLHSRLAAFNTGFTHDLGCSSQGLQPTFLAHQPAQPGSH